MSRWHTCGYESFEDWRSQVIILSCSAMVDSYANFHPSQSRNLDVSFVSAVSNSPCPLSLSPAPLADLVSSATRMAITFNKGVILGADSRTTTGAYIANRVTDKLTQVHDTIWCCRSGSAADTQAVADIVDYHLGMYGITNDEQPTTQTAAALFQELCYDNKDQLRWVEPFSSNRSVG